MVRFVVLFFAIQFTYSAPLGPLSSLFNATTMTIESSTTAPAEVTVTNLLQTGPPSTAPTISLQIVIPSQSPVESQLSASEWIASIDAKHAAWFMVVVLGVAFCICCGCCLLLFCLRVSRREAKEMKMKFDCTLSELHRIRAESAPHLRESEDKQMIENRQNAIQYDHDRRRRHIAGEYISGSAPTTRRSSNRLPPHSPQRLSRVSYHAVPVRTFSHQYADEYKVTESKKSDDKYGNGDGGGDGDGNGGVDYGVNMKRKEDDTLKMDGERNQNGNGFTAHYGQYGSHRVTAMDRKRNKIQFEDTPTDLQSGAFSNSTSDPTHLTTDQDHDSEDMHGDDDRNYQRRGRTAGSSSDFTDYTTTSVTTTLASEYTKTTAPTAITGVSATTISALSPVASNRYPSCRTRSPKTPIHGSTAGNAVKKVAQSQPAYYVKSHRKEKRFRSTLTDSERWNRQMRQLHDLHASIYGNNTSTGSKVKKEVKKIQHVVGRKETTSIGDAGEYDIDYTISDSNDDDITDDESSEARMTRKVTSLGGVEEGVFDDYEDHPYVD